MVSSHVTPHRMLCVVSSSALPAPRAARMARHRAEREAGSSPADGSSAGGRGGGGEGARVCKVERLCGASPLKRRMA